MPPVTDKNKVTMAIMLCLVAVLISLSASMFVIFKDKGENSTIISTSTPSEIASTTITVQGKYKVIPISIGGSEFQTMIADTEELQELGLGDRVSLEASSAMLFVFDHPARYSFWMKNMQFAIDILWIDESGTIITIADSVTPESYPKSFSPSSNATYVLEVAAGTSKKLNIKNGDRIIFDKNLLKKSSI